MRIRIIGAGAAGLTAAYELVTRAQASGRDLALQIVEKNLGPGQGCSFHAGGMIAPWCEAESTEPIVASLGAEALEFWTRAAPLAERRGSLVVAPERDRAELVQFSRRTSHFTTLDRAGLAALEPDLAGNFSGALYFEEEAHLDPRAALAFLAKTLAAEPNVIFDYGVDATTLPDDCDWTLDCRGYAAKPDLAGLRGVKGEMMVLRSADIKLARPVRMLHPRHPVYVVPRADGTFMVGATMIENEERARVTARSLVELVNSAFAIHPAFGEAEVVETGSDLRPSFWDNLPRIRREGRKLYLNGLYRHGFLLSPALARRAAQIVLEDAHFPEVMDEDRGQWRDARRARA
ncbi:FAD-dependent oxidoreductase [Rhodoblastus acidophilus]|uniref:FAD-dependent oxidoreductase n=1 Tax=Candidatus Rhodoblastus alkanivorans TaxID=2954117 RepID=A0ABS9Z7U5_9HYPH|nr:FAD-dependent oxidoreductase [Candidatus Rhodoblastus alkanivorans]MCI4678693.1 FAD-dependent oxidoreductase [Candidatus Rhodoblastus alkanivorans]MCI4683511.1 FAD-dependent oxidoreductase [Candidatus Rhodoblastus alkanivorans]MDI4640826.1 FAD-dependent oxidoreductase [Rhodoblastus acidophilus]